jgi:CRP-like cAMP-binding protein
MSFSRELYTPLIEDITSLVDISEKELELVISSFKPKMIAKKEFLLNKGDVSNHMRFIAEGCLRSYTLDNNVQEHILQLGIKGWWINDLYSYLTKKPATHFVQAIQSSIVLQIHRDSLEKLYDQVPSLERFFRIKYQKAYTALQERHLDEMSLTAKERYEDFQKKYRDIEQSVPQYMIASYLGITPEHLSSLRKNSQSSLS